MKNGKKVCINDGCFWTTGSKSTWCAVHHPRTSGVLAIPGRWQFVQRYIGRRGIHFSYRGSNPNLCLGQTRRLCLQYNDCIRYHPTADHTVFAKAPVGRWLGRGSVTHWNVDATSHSFDRPVRERCYRDRSRYRVPRGYDPCTNYGHDRWWPWHWRWQWEDWLTRCSPVLPGRRSGKKTVALGTIDTDHWRWRHPTAIVWGWDIVDIGGWHRPLTDGKDEIRVGCDPTKRFKRQAMHRLGLTIHSGLGVLG